MNVPNELLQEKNYGENRILFIGTSQLAQYVTKAIISSSAGYVGSSLQLGKLNVYAGVRFLI